MLTEKRKHKMKVGGTLGLILGVFIFFVMYAESKSWFTLFIIPVAAIIGLSQAYLSPADDEE